MDARLLACATAAGVLLLDRLTKWLIESRVSDWETIVVIPGFFNIIHTRNPGAAFSLLAGASPALRRWLLVTLSLAAVALVAGMLWKSAAASPGHGRGARFGLSLVLGGALGNLYDRLLAGAVTDFLEFYLGAFRWPAFNVADSAITIGIALVLLDLWRSRHAPQRT